MAAARAPLLERDDEVAALDALLADACAHHGALALVEAPAGCGKTALLTAATRRLTRAGACVLVARGSALERAYPYGIVRQLLEGLLGDPAVHERVLAGAAAPAAALFTSAAIPPADEPMAADRMFPMVHALYWTVVNLASSGPLVIAVDDAHDADTASLRFLAYLGRRVAMLPVVVVLALRPAAQAGANPILDELRADPSLPILRPQPLSSASVALLAGERLGATPALAFTEACRRATGGNPFYVEELLRQVLAEGRAPTAANAEWAAAVGPPTIVRSVLFRMAELPAAAVPVARACAVLGDGARLTECAWLANVSTAEAASAADVLVRVGILAESPGLAFRHPILQAAVLADLGAHERAQWHARAAALLTGDGAGAERVALHLLCTEPGADPQTVAVLRAAASSAVRAGAPAAAIVFLERALAEPVLPAEEPDVLFDLGVVEARLGFEVGRTHLAASVRGTNDSYLRANRAAHLAEVCARAGVLGEALTALTEAIDILGDGHEELRLTLEATRFFTARLDLSTSDRALGWAPELLSRLDGPDSAGRRQLAVYLATDAAAHVSGAQARALLDTALAPPGLLHFVPPESMAVGMALYSLLAVEDHARFDTLADDALRTSSERGALMAYVSVSMFRGMQRRATGRLAEAEADVRGALESPGRRGWHSSAAAVVATLGLILLDQGRVDEAAELLQSYPQRYPPRDYSTMLLLLMRGRLRMATGRVSDGVADLLRCGQAAEAFAMRNPTLLPWRGYAAEALLRRGEIGRARALATEELGFARSLAGPLAQGAALRGLGGVTIAAGHLDEGLARLREALAVLNQPTAAVQRAATLVALGAAERRAGRLTAARPCLADALDLATRMGMAGLAATARDELISAGARPRRAEVSGPLALTSSELRVARLAAHGCSNSEIAQELFVSRKTVEKHLGNAYRKLAITSRAELDSAVLDEAAGLDAAAAR